MFLNEKGSLLNLKPNAFIYEPSELPNSSLVELNEAALRPYLKLIHGIMEALVNDSFEFIRQFNIDKIEAEKLARFVVHSYGNLADYRGFLKMQSKLFNLDSYLCEDMANELEKFEEDLNTNPDKFDIQEYISIKYENFIANDANITDYAALARKLLAINGR